MFKICLWKKKKEIDLNDLRGKENYSPQNDWARLLTFFFLWILFAVVASLYTFLKVVKEDVSVRQNREDSQIAETLDTSHLKTAADFVRSRMAE